MSDQTQERFERNLQQAIKNCLQRRQAPKGLAEKVRAKLEEATKAEPADELEAIESFHQRLAQNIRHSHMSLVEPSRFRQLKEQVEESLDAQSETALGDTPKWNPLNPQAVRFERQLSSLTHRVLTAGSAPSGLKESIEARLREERTAPKVVTLPSRNLWRQGLAAVASIAAVFALLAGTFLSSADQALANSVRRDHQVCFRSLPDAENPNASRGSGYCKKSEAKAIATLGQTPPELSLSDCWELRVSKLCKADDGTPMLHRVYVSCDDNGKARVLSCHFIPPKHGQSQAMEFTNQSPKELAEGDFPVVAWQVDGWTCTACTSDMNSESLRVLVAGL